MKAVRGVGVFVGMVVLIGWLGTPTLAAYDWNLVKQNRTWMQVVSINRNQTGDVGVWAGAFLFKVAAAPDASMVGKLIETYCVDFTTVSGNDWYTRLQGQKTSGGIPPMTDTAWEDLAWLDHVYFDDSLSSRDKSTGFQLAVWDRLYDAGAAGDGYTLTESLESGGKFWASGTAVTEGNWYLSQLQTARSSGWVDYRNETVFYEDDQDQMGKNIPEIPAVALAPIGLAVVGFVRRRFTA